MAFSIYLKNKYILATCILTMLVVAILKLYKNYCILTNIVWSNATCILYFPILILQILNLMDYNIYILYD